VPGAVGDPDVEVAERVLAGECGQPARLALGVRAPSGRMDALQSAAIEIGGHGASARARVEVRPGKPGRTRRHHGRRGAGAPMPPARMGERVEVHLGVGVREGGPALAAPVVEEVPVLEQAPQGRSRPGAVGATHGRHGVAAGQQRRLPGGRLRQRGRAQRRIDREHGASRLAPLRESREPRRARQGRQRRRMRPREGVHRRVVGAQPHAVEEQEQDRVAQRPTPTAAFIRASVRAAVSRARSAPRARSASSSARSSISAS
jgi:hypothetical protein